MTRFRRLALAVLALAATSLAAPALAAPNGACVWNGLSESSRATLIDGYRAKGVKSLLDIDVDPAMEAALTNACRLKPGEGVVAGEILGSMILEKGADAVLFEKGGIPRGALDKAWAGLSEADREALRVFSLAAMRDEEQGVAAAVLVIDRVTTDLRLPSADLGQHVFAYLLGRSIRDGREAGRP